MDNADVDSDSEEDEIPDVVIRLQVNIPEVEGPNSNNMTKTTKKRAVMGVRMMSRPLLLSSLSPVPLVSIHHKLKPIS